MSKIRTQTIDDYKAKRRQEPGKKANSTVSPATINKELRHLRAVLRVARGVDPRDFRFHRCFGGLEILWLAAMVVFFMYSQASGLRNHSVTLTVRIFKSLSYSVGSVSRSVIYSLKVFVPAARILTMNLRFRCFSP